MIARSRLLLFCLLAMIAAPAAAAVELTFYSKELGASFPHAFVTLRGTLDRDGRAVHADFGFTAKSVGPAILFGKVAGKVLANHGAAYIQASDRHFSLRLADADYDRVMALVERWRELAQPSYDLDRRNCVHFVASIAETIGMKADTTRLMKRPRSFLDALAAANRQWLAAHSASVYGPKAAPPPRASRS